MLKLKKIVPAFAYIGIGDDTAHAVYSSPSTDYDWKLDVSGDVDFFYWTNNTGSTKTLNGYVISPSRKNYDLQVNISTSNGLITINPTDNGAGKWDGFGVTVLPGEKVYFRIKGHTSSDYDTTQTYKFRFTAS
jgi:hypothetical protein